MTMGGVLGACGQLPLVVGVKKPLAAVVGLAIFWNVRWAVAKGGTDSMGHPG
jgi:hypothetical protein